jgi:TolB-like protein/Flp pilus assembly protein TadD
MAYMAGSWLLIEVTETLFPIYGLSDAAIRLVVTLVAIGFPVLLVVSWFFELTPEGLKFEKDIDPSMSVTQHTGEKLDRVIIVLMAMALAYFALDKFVLSEMREASMIESVRQEARNDVLMEAYGDRSIVVLPFVNMSGDPEQEYFSDGISEEILNLLANIPELRVISRSSAFAFKGRDVATPEVAEQLNVAHVLEGSVRKVGNKVRITAQLIEARSDSHLWSESYDRELTDIFAVQDDIAAAIGEALKAKLGLTRGETLQPDINRTANVNAYTAYLQGRELLHRRGRENLEQAVREFERALRLNEAFAPAHALLAIATTLLLDDLNSYGTLSLDEVQRRAIPHLDRAQALEPELAEVHAGRALLALKTNDMESSIVHARKALSINPSNIDAMNWLYLALGALGRYEEADATLQQILLFDPLTVSGRINYIGWLASIGRVREAHEMADQLLIQSPEFGYLAHADTSFIYEGKIADSISWALRASADNIYLVYAFIALGEYAEARRINEEQTYWVDLAEGRYEEVIEQTQTAIRLDPDDQNALFMAADALYESGRIGEARLLFERFHDFLPEGRPISQPLSDLRSIRLALARRNTGDEEGAQFVAEIVRQDFAARRRAGRNNQEQFLLEAMLAAFEHDPERVVEALTSALQLGMRNPQAFEDPIFEDVRDDPRFVALQQELHIVIAAEREKVLQLICFNNPVPDNWQPLPETCEGVLKKEPEATF